MNRRRVLGSAVFVEKGKLNPDLVVTEGQASFNLRRPELHEKKVFA